MSMERLLEEMLAADLVQRECCELAAWLPFWLDKQTAHEQNGPFVAAVTAASRADRLAWAFFCGYQGAIQAAFPSQARMGRASAFCVNESGRKLTELATALHSRAGGLRLQGAKSWTLAGVNDLQLFVLARTATGPAKGPGSLVCVRLPLRTAGVTLSAGRAQGPVPELPHAEVRFDEVAIEPAQLVAGDGYADHAKPFRLREDIFVTACTLAYLFGEGRAAAWPARWAQKCLAALCGLHACAALDPRRSDTHVLATGVLAGAGELIDETEFLWACSDTERRSRWRRDEPLLSLGKEARRQRARKAWQAEGWPVPESDAMGGHISGAMDFL